MSKEHNIALHLSVIQRAKSFPVGSDKRMSIITRSIQGIIRAKLPTYNPSHL